MDELPRPFALLIGKVGGYVQRRVLIPLVMFGRPVSEEFVEAFSLYREWLLLDFLIYLGVKNCLIAPKLSDIFVLYKSLRARGIRHKNVQPMRICCVGGDVFDMHLLGVEPNHVIHIPAFVDAI